MKYVNTFVVASSQPTLPVALKPPARMQHFNLYVKCNVVNSIIRFLSFLQTNTRSVSGDGTSPAFYDDAHRPGIVVAGRRGSLSSRYEQ